MSKSDSDDIIQFPAASGHEPRSRLAQAEFNADIAGEEAVIGVSTVMQKYARSRRRDYVVQDEQLAGLWFASRPEADQQAILRTDLQSLIDMLTRPGFPYRGLSVQPRDLFSGCHIGDILHLVSQRPPVWRLVALEGLRSGALLFKQLQGIAIVLVNPAWDGDFAMTPLKEDVEDDIFRCAMAMKEPYPETLPHPSWAAGTRHSQDWQSFDNDDGGEGR